MVYEVSINFCYRKKHIILTKIVTFLLTWNSKIISLAQQHLMDSSTDREAPSGAFAISTWGISLKTIVYIDGFNLFYGCLKGKSYKWLDLKSLFDKVLGKNFEVKNIKYFTALVKNRPSDFNAKQKQMSYIRALDHYIEEFEVHYGHFSRHNVRMENANPPPNTLEVIKTEEKGSDVNLAVHMLNDAWLDSYECAVIVSNDSDMAESMKLVREHHPGKQIVLVTPHGKHASLHLKKYAHKVRTIRKSAIKKCQLPDRIPDSNIYKPKDWN